MIKRLFAAAVATTLFVPFFSDACSVFSLNEDGVYVAKNYDWMPMHGHGALFVNKRGMAKTAQTLRTQNAMEWVSKYGSVTFSQMGLEFPVSGMNETGLSAEILQLGETAHIQESDPRPALNEAQWLQYQLDNFSTVAEVLQHVDSYRVEQAFLGVHYFVCDRSGECGVFEYLKGKLVVHSGSRLQPKILTNSTYEDSLSHLNGKSKVILASAVPDSRMAMSAASLDRFAEATRLLSERSESTARPVAFAFDVLSKIEMTTFLRTQWSIVHDLGRGRVEFRTRTQPSIKSLDLAALNFSCKQEALMMDIQQKDAGDVGPRLAFATYESNKALVDENWMLLGSNLRQLAADYPRTHTRCVNP